MPIATMIPSPKRIAGRDRRLKLEHMGALHDYVVIPYDEVDPEAHQRIVFGPPNGMQ